jgi:nucleoside-diphosphate-sugar epimerase
VYKRERSFAQQLLQLYNSRLSVSNKKIESTGWFPNYTLDDGIQELIKSYQVLIPRMTSEFRNGFPLGYANNT